MNDLTQFEKNLLRVLNRDFGTKFTHKEFMEWSSSKEQIKNNLRADESIYEVMGIYVAIKDK